MRLYICDRRANSDGYHEIHTSKCPDRPPEKHTAPVGEFNNCELALQYLNKLNGRRGFKFIGCHLCCRPCARKNEHF